MIRGLPTLLLFGCLLSAALAPAEALAEQRRGASLDKQKAAEYFNRAEVLFEAGDYAKAAQAFILAYEAAPHPSVLANIAVSFDKAGKPVEAIRWYRRYLRESPGATDDAKIRTRLGQLETLVGELRVTCAARHCEVRIDGVAEGPAPLSVVVLPGPHSVETVIEGKGATSIRVSAVAGKIIDVELGSTPPAPVIKEPLGPQEPTVKWSGPRLRLRLPTWIGAGVTVLAGGLTIGFGAATVNAKQEFVNQGQTSAALKDKGDAYRTAANTMLAMTCVAAVATTVLVVLDVRAHRRRAVGVAALPTPEGYGLSLAASF